MLRKNDLLSSVRIASPCSASWAEMEGDERVRHCSQCRLNVFNLSEMSAAEAESLLRKHAGRLCVRIYRRADGTVLTRDCPKGFAAVRRRLRIALAGAFAMALSMIGCKGETPKIDEPGKLQTTQPLTGTPVPPDTQIMGKVATSPMMGEAAVPEKN